MSFPHSIITLPPDKFTGPNSQIITPGIQAVPVLKFFVLSNLEISYTPISIMVHLLLRLLF